MAKKTIFARITKVNEAARTVSGRMVQEVPDHSDEIFDYDSSKPYFKAWVEETSAASGGKSLGNVRAMHGPVAAGKVVGIDFHDTEKAMDIVTKIVDDQEWKKVLEGVYTGFSIGGKYVGKVEEGAHTRYTASPNEVSLVDAPCVPTALFFDVHKADGAVIQKAFKPGGTGVDTSGEDKNAEDAKNRGVGEGEPDGDEGKQAAPGGDEADADAKAAAAAAADKDKKKEGAGNGKEGDGPTKAAGVIEYDVEGTPEDLAALQKVMADNKLSISAVTAVVGDVLNKSWGKLFEGEAAKATFADPANRRFPIDTPAQVKAALYYVSQDAAKALYTEDEYGVVKDAVAAAWQEKVNKDVPDNLDKAITDADLAKSFYLSSQFCTVLDSLYYLVSSAQYEYLNGANAQLAVKCKMAMQDLAACVSSMVAADTSALSKEPDGDEGVISFVRTRTSELMKACEVTEEVITKVGARNAKADAQRIQGIHDLSVQLGAKSPKTNPNGVLEEQKKADDTGDLSKLVDAQVQKALAPVLEELRVLKAQPAPARAVLRAVAKNQDLVDGNPQAGTPIDPVRKADGAVDEVATDIKSLHKLGGVPLFSK